MMDKDSSIKWLNALNNATLLVSNIASKEWMEIKTTIEDLANWMFRLMPQGNELEEKIKSCNSKTELLSLKEEVAKTGDKSLFNIFNDKVIEIDAREQLLK